MDELYLGQSSCPCAPCWREMEQAGFLVDRKALAGVRRDARPAASTGDAGRHLRRWRGRTFNINSTQQLGHILFDKLGLPPVKKTKTGYSTNAEVLEKLRGQHPIIDDILDYRQLCQARNPPMWTGWPRSSPPTGASTPASRTPSPPPGGCPPPSPTCRTSPSAPSWGRELRKMFVAAGPGNVLVDADYSQIELRLLAHIVRGRGDDRRLPAAARTSTPSPPPRCSACRRRRSPTHMRRRGQGGELRHRLRHLRLLPVPGHRRHRGGGQGVYGQLFRTLLRRPGLYGRVVAEGQGSTATCPPCCGRRRWLPELKSSNFNTALLRRAGGPEHAHPGHRRRHHQAGHDPGRTRPCGRRGWRPGWCSRSTTS